MLRRNFFASPVVSSSSAMRATFSQKSSASLASSSSKNLSIIPSSMTPSTFRSYSSSSSSSSSIFKRFAAFSSAARFYSSSSCASTASSTSYGAHNIFIARRFNSSTTGGQQQANTSNNTGKEGGEQQQQNQEKPAGAAGTEQPKAGGGGGISGHINGIKADILQFPDIYNWQNMLSLAFFTIFCLSSTGTQVEADWWLKHWAIDSDSHFRPWSILFHSLHMNNFMSMIFSILVLHNSLHPLVHGLAGGSAALFQYVCLVSVLSGIAMWAGNYAWYGNGAAVDVASGKSLKAEKQFGPWDIAAAVLLMQYLRLGIAPHRFLFSFNGWVKYACAVGGVCILYYDPQPVVCGAFFGFLFCKFAPAFRGIAAAV